MTNNSDRLSRSAETYHAEFCRILQNMIHEMTCAPLTDSISHNFIVQMIPHHRAAIQMSQNILNYTADMTLRAIASGIITEQTKSIENMCASLPCCACYTSTAASLQDFQCKMNQIMQQMFSEMRCARTTNQISCDFMWEMIPHHEGAVKMSKTTLRECICPELVPILKAIISSQEKGIAEMQTLLRNLKCQ